VDVVCGSAEELGTCSLVGESSTLADTTSPLVTASPSDHCSPSPASDTGTHTHGRTLDGRATESIHTLPPHQPCSRIILPSFQDNSKHHPPAPGPCTLRHANIPIQPTHLHPCHPIVSACQPATKSGLCLGHSPHPQSSDATLDNRPPVPAELLVVPPRLRMLTLPLFASAHIALASIQ
jgi:hypothetical protein